MTMKLIIKNDGPKMYKAQVVAKEGDTETELCVLAEGESQEVYGWKGRTIIINEIEVSHGR